jgi:Leucine-rich repeat (LRR) protein
MDAKPTLAAISFSAGGRLDMSGRQLASLPEPFGDEAEAPSELNLYDNRLTCVPDAIWRWTSLRRLNLTVNRFAAIPEDIGALSGLEMLDLGHNELTSLPACATSNSGLHLTWVRTHPACVRAQRTSREERTNSVRIPLKGYVPMNVAAHHARTQDACVPRDPRTGRDKFQ